MIQIQSTVMPTEQLSEMEWLEEFKVGILAPKPTEGKEKAMKMMELWKDKNGNINFNSTIKKLSHA